MRDIERRKRVRLVAYVAPETKDMLQEYANNVGVSLSLAVIRALIESFTHCDSEADYLLEVARRRAQRLKE